MPHLALDRMHNIRGDRVVPSVCTLSDDVQPSLNDSSMLQPTSVNWLSVRCVTP